MSPRGKLLAVGAVAVLAAIVSLVLRMRGGDETVAAPTGGSDTPSPVTEPPLGSNAPAGKHATITAAEPRPAQGSAEPAYREYMVGGRLVRDHRKGNKPPIDIPPAIHAPNARMLDSALTHAIGQKVKAVMQECAAALPPEARGTSPRLEGLVTIAIKDQQASITSSTVQLRDVVGAAVAPIKACVEQKSLGVIHPTEEADLATYDLTLSFAM